MSGKETGYISREAAINAICGKCYYVGYKEKESCLYRDGKLGGCDEYEALKSVPPADVRPVVRAEWIDYNPEDPYDPRMKCSNCGVVAMPLVNDVFCPFCGADMREEAGNER